MSTHRLHGLDFSRAVLMVLGLFFHAGLVYGDVQGWRVLSEQNSIYLQFFSNFIHQFRMEAFYIISGIFYYLVLAKNRDGFLKDRVSRALIPMLFVGILINPVMNVFSYNRGYELNFLYILNGDWLGHLWFLGNLIIYFIVSVPICRLMTKLETLNVKNFLLLSLAIFTVGILGKVLSKLYLNFTFVFISFESLLYFYSYFLIGIIAYKNIKSFNSLLSLKYLPIFLLVYFSFVTSSLFLLSINSNISKLLGLIAHLPIAIVVLSLLTYLGSNESKLIRWFSDASYTIYLLHQPLLVIFYFFIFKELQFNPYIEYLLLIFIVFSLSLFFHLLLIKRHKVLKFLFNGIPLR